MAYSADALNDEIISLPGWPSKVPLPSRQFSGYLDVDVGDRNNEKGHLHYWFVESELDPDNSPVVLWLNGGPGCSSLDGFFYENGPFTIVNVNALGVAELSPSDSKANGFEVDGLRLNVRPERWNRFANMLFIESPIGVGFSYHNNATYYSLNDDDNTALRNLEALEHFYKKFPGYLKNDLYLTGESYAGIYIPTLAEAILLSVDAGTYSGANLKGIAVGNGCTGYTRGICGFYYTYACEGLYYESKFLLSLSFVGPDLQSKIAQECDWNKCKASREIFIGKNSTDIFNNPNITYPLSNKCLDLLDDVAILFGDINVYNVFGECVWDSCADENGDINTMRVPVYNRPLTDTLLPYERRLESIKSKYSTIQRSLANDDTKARGPAGCMDSALATAYVSRPDVQAAIHVRAPGFCWASCNRAKGWDYNSTRPDLPRDTYPLLISRLKVIIYNGDWDACVPYTDNVGWVESMGFNASSPWQPWTFLHPDNTTQIGGYNVEYDVSSISLIDSNYQLTGSFSLYTVRGSGHMVPTDNAPAAIALLSRLINRNDHGKPLYELPSFQTSCHSKQQAMHPGIAAAITIACLFVVIAFGYFLLEIRRLRQRLYRANPEEDTGGRSRLGAKAFTISSHEDDDMEVTNEIHLNNHHSNESPYFAVTLQDKDDNNML
jgi:carboxypeptidase C (cathepsin A)